MRNACVLLALASIALGAGLISSPDRAGAAFHLMRVYAVGGGALGDADIQWVELRMTDPGQNFVANTHLCFYDAAGAPHARFTFATGVGNGVDEASILVGSSEFDSAWAAGSPDFTFAAANTVALGGTATPEHPIASPAGKVAFGTDGAVTPALMCGGSFFLIDSVAYGTGYTGGVDFGSAFGSDLPVAGTNAIRLQGPICIPGSIGSPCPQARDNSIFPSGDYALVDVNTAANNPRNNSNQTGPLSTPDADGDGVPDASDNCPLWPNLDQNLPPWSVPVGDSDCDGYPDTVAVAGRADEAFLGTDATEHCAADTIANNDGPGGVGGGGIDHWPLDFDDNRLLDLGDILKYNLPFGAVGPGGLYTQRLDLDKTNVLDLGDVLQFNLVWMVSCVP